MGLQQHLKEQGISTRIYYPKSMHMQKTFADLKIVEKERSVTKELCKRIFSLPMHLYLEDEEITYSVMRVRVQEMKQNMNYIRERGKLYIVVPCYNEEEALERSAQLLMEKLEDLVNKEMVSVDSRIVFVDDGSKDKTWSIIESLFRKNKMIIGLRFAHNRGHQNAILAGMMYSKDYCDFTITIDADLQQDISAMDLFIEEYLKGSEIVYGVRNSRNTDSFFKKSSASLFYKIMKFLGCNIYDNSADYRLMSSRALDALSEYEEVNLFLRGIIPDIGLKSSVVHFDVYPRLQGESKYSLSKMVTLAADGVTSFSIKPIRMILSMGLLAILVGFIYIVHALYAFCVGTAVSGWSSILISIWLLGGAVLVSLGIIGEYIGRSYMETKKRPRYFFWEILSEDK